MAVNETRYRVPWLDLRKGCEACQWFLTYDAAAEFARQKGGGRIEMCDAATGVLLDSKPVPSIADANWGRERAR